MMVRSWVITAAGVIALTGIAVGGVAWAVQSPVSSGIVSVCYNSRSGAVRLNVTGSCTKGGDRTPITWSQTGVVGQSPTIEDVTWNATLPATSGGPSEMTSNTTIDVGSVLTTLSASVTSGDLTGCSSQSIAIFTIDSSGSQRDLGAISGSGFVAPQDMTIKQTVETSATHLFVQGSCTASPGNSPGFPSGVAISVTLQWTHPVSSRTIN